MILVIVLILDKGKNMIAIGPWAVVKCDESISKITGSDMTTITFINNKGKIVHTYVDHANKNYAFWIDIIQGFDRGFGIIVDDLRYKVKIKQVQQKYIPGYNFKEDLINADSKPTILAVTDSLQEVLDRLAEVLND